MHKVTVVVWAGSSTWPDLWNVKFTVFRELIAQSEATLAGIGPKVWVGSSLISVNGSLIVKVEVRYPRTSLLNMIGIVKWQPSSTFTVQPLTTGNAVVVVDFGVLMIVLMEYIRLTSRFGGFVFIHPTWLSNQSVHLQDRQRQWPRCGEHWPGERAQNLHTSRTLSGLFRAKGGCNGADSRLNFDKLW